MAKIVAVSASYNEQGSLAVVDNKGRIWLKASINGQWSQIEDLPEEPVEPVFPSKVESDKVEPILGGQSVKEKE